MKKLKAWTLEEEHLLIQGIERYGIGEWERIRRDFLPDWVGLFRIGLCDSLGYGRYSLESLQTDGNSAH